MVSFRYYKFTPLKTRSLNSDAVQISELKITNNNERVDYSNALAYNPDGLNPTNEGPEKL